MGRGGGVEGMGNEKEKETADHVSGAKSGEAGT